MRADRMEVDEDTYARGELERGDDDSSNYYLGLRKLTYEKNGCI